MQAPPLHGPEAVRVGGEQTAHEPSVAAASAQFHGTTSTLMLLGMAHSCICATKDGVVAGTQSAPTPKPKLSISWPFSGTGTHPGLEGSEGRAPGFCLPGSPAQPRAAQGGYLRTRHGEPKGHPQTHLPEAGAGNSAPGREISMCKGTEDAARRKRDGAVCWAGPGTWTWW